MVGQATGRAINLRAEAEGGPIVLVGTTERDLAACRGAVDGLLTGPQAGDLGDWHATATALGGGRAPRMRRPGGGRRRAGDTVPAKSGTPGGTGCGAGRATRGNRCA